MLMTTSDKKKSEEIENRTENIGKYGIFLYSVKSRWKYDS